MKIKKKLFLFVMFLLMAFILSSCGIIPQSPEGKISGQVLIPPFEMSKDITGWVPAANAVVTIVDADRVTHTTTTDENGYYAFLGIAVNPNTIITATVELIGDTLIFKDVIPQAVAADEDYDAGDMDPESTALALLLEALIASGENPSDIDLQEIKSDNGFLALVSQVTSVLEEGGDVKEDPDIAEMIEDIINPPVPPSPSPPSPTPKPDTTISIAAIPGVTAPIAGETPVTAITETAQYTGTVTWIPADDTFGYSTVYTATITLTAKEGYTFTGVAANFFTVAGANTVTNPANSGVVTAVFPETGEEPDTIITIAAISGVTAPVAGETPVTAITETDEYTGTVSWDPADATFGYSTVYTATITLTAKTGYTFTGVAANFFTVAGATATNDADSGVVTAVFPATEESTGPVYNQINETYYNTIQAAIDDSTPDDEIVVSAGTYNENIVIDNKNITLKSSDPADSAIVAATIIDGQDLDSVVKILNGDTSTLEGFTIQNGDEPDYGGGGIFISGSSPVIRYNIIGDKTDDGVDTGNTGDCGGGICIVDGSIEPHIYQNKIIGNKGYYGGGMYIGYASPLVANNNIKDNVSDYEGGGIAVFYSKEDGYCPTIKDNTIEYNKTTESSGGGIVVGEQGSAIIENNRINNNEASIYGGGIHIYANSDAYIREGNIIEYNEAGYNGGGIYIYSDGIITITSNTINNNIANIASGSYSGGGIYVEYSSPTIGGTDETDTDNFNTICGNTPDQVDPDSFPNNDYCVPETYILTMDVSPEGYGTSADVTPYGPYSDYPADFGVSISAVADVGYEFVNWTAPAGTFADSNSSSTYFTMPAQDVTVTANFGTPAEYFDFDTDTRTITGYDAVGGGLDVIIPPTIGGIPVEHIGDQAFSNKGLTSITIPDSVTTIGIYAFYKNLLGEVNIPDSVTTISYGAFSTNALTLLDLGNSVTAIGGNAFYDNQLTEVFIPDSVTAIGSVHFDDGYVFANNLLTSVEFGNSLSIIGYAAFENNNLSSVTIANGVTIGNDAFKNNTLDLITIGIHVYIIDSDDSDTMGTNQGFLAAYNWGGAGTYEYTGGVWVKE
jgi:hypothetical protein